jgi:NAD dependent epimerase/dehydratase family enzyme
MHRPAIIPAPAFALELALGEMADALLLASQRVAPSRLEQLGFRFAYRDLDSALASILAAS